MRITPNLLINFVKLKKILTITCMSVIIVVKMTTLLFISLRKIMTWNWPQMLYLNSLKKVMTLIWIIYPPLIQEDTKIFLCQCLKTKIILHVWFIPSSSKQCSNVSCPKHSCMNLSSFLSSQKQRASEKMKNECSSY